MRRVAFLWMLLLLVGWLACRVEIAPGGDQAGWVRTPDGWEKTTYWAISPTYAPPLHPSVVALGQALASMVALVAFPMPYRRRRSAGGPRLARAARIPRGRIISRVANRRKAVGETV